MNWRLETGVGNPFVIPEDVLIQRSEEVFKVMVTVFCQ